MPGGCGDSDARFENPLGRPKPLNLPIYAWMKKWCQKFVIFVAPGALRKSKASLSWMKKWGRGK